MASPSGLSVVPAGEAAWDLACGPRALLRGIAPRVRLASGRALAAADYPGHSGETAGSGLTRRHFGLDAAPDLIERVSASADAAEVFVEVELVGGPAGQDVDEVDVLAGAVSLGGRDLWMQRFGTWMPSDEVCYCRVDDVAPAGAPWIASAGGTVSRSSETLVILRDLAGPPALLAGFVTLRRQRCRLLVETASGQHSLRGVVSLDGRPIGPGERVTTERLVLRVGPSAERLLDRWAALVAEAQPPRVPPCAPAGWSDWQFYRENKSEDDILESLEVLADLKRRGYPVEYVVIDGGYCPHQSEWLEPGERFPHGIPWLFDRIRAKGLKPGLWFAPYITNVATRVAREHSDWMMRHAETGEMLRHGSNVGDAYVLDLSVPEAMDWMAGVVRVMVHEWGVRWLKLDGPALRHYAGGRPRDRRMTCVEMVARSLQVIRDVAGDALVEGEGYYGPSIGFVDLQRVNGDNHPLWSRPDGSDLNGVGKVVWTQLVVSAFMHRRFWLNHSENVILRDFPSPFYHLKRQAPAAIEPVLPQNEMQYQLTCHFLSGAPVLLTDPLAGLRRSPRGWRLIRRLLPCNGLAARPLDEFNGGRYPCLYFRRVHADWASWTLLGALNHDDAPRDFCVALDDLGLSGPHLAFEAWTERFLGRIERALAVRDVPAHGGRLVCLRRALDRPQVLATSMHLSQGAAELAGVRYDEAAQVLDLSVVHPEQDDERLFIHVPAGWRLGTVDTDATAVCVDQRRGECVVVRFDPAAGVRTDFRLRFHRH